MYVNDEWRMTENFTLSLGVRHDAEFNTMNNKYTVPWASDPVLQGIPELKDYLNTGNRKNQLGNFSPRVSFSWDPTKQNQTFVRGGFGIIYDRVTSFIGFQERKNSTWRVYNFTNPGTTDPAVLRARVIAGQSGSPAPILIKHDMKTPHSIQMSLGIGHQFTSEFGLNIDYVRQHMDNLYVQRNPNYLDKTVTPNRRKLTANYGDIVLWDDIGQVRLSRRSCCRARGSGNRRASTSRTRSAGTRATSTLAGAAELRVPVPVQSPAHVGRRAASRRAFGSDADSVRLHAVVDQTIASPRPFVTIDGRDINLDNITGDDYIGGTVSATGNRTTRPSNAWKNWYRTVDLRLARPLYTRGGKKVSRLGRSVQPVQLEQQLSYGGTQFNAAGAPFTSFGVPTGALSARQGQVGVRVDW